MRFPFHITRFQLTLTSLKQLPNKKYRNSYTDSSVGYNTYKYENKLIKKPH